MPSESEPVKKAFAQEMLARQDERLHYELMMAARRMESGTGMAGDEVLQWQTAMQRYLACARNSTDLSRRIFLRASSAYRRNPDHLRLEIEHLEQQLDEGGLEKGLQWLNARVPHRFTAVYRLEADALRNICLVDKLEGDYHLGPLAFVPLPQSFCQYVIRDGSFRTSSTSMLQELGAHPYRGVLESYMGVPLMSNPVEIYGTLCHFDFASLPLADEEYALLELAALVLPRYLQQCA